MEFPTVRINNLRRHLTRRNIRYAAIALIVLIVGLALWRMVASDTPPETAKGPREVTVGRVSDLMNGGSNLSVVGEVQSKNEARINAEANGRITRVNASLGSRVAAGAILAEIENSSQRAALLQAEGAFDAAKAATVGTRGSALATILGAYGAMSSAVDDAVGQMVSDPESANSVFTVSSKDTQALADIEAMRPMFKPILARHEAQAQTLTSSSDLGSELATVEDELRKVRSYLDTVLKALNAGVSRNDISIATISGYVADVTAARTSITASLSAIIAARSATEGAGAVTSSEASVKQAEGAYNAALASLEKTRIRAPISGTVTNFSIKLGDTVSPGQLIAVVSNIGALEIVSAITEEDRSSIAIGNEVAIEGGLTGTVVKIAPALDPLTHMIEVRIGLSEDATKRLTSGQSVRVELKRSAPSPENSGIRIPVAALKMTASESVVYTVSASSTLVARPVKIGSLSGTHVEITEGLSLDDEIVTDVRGKKEGDEVTVKGQ
jgi:RND family efflux transporter MFP subunit